MRVAINVKSLFCNHTQWRLFVLICSSFPAIFFNCMQYKYKQKHPRTHFCEKYIELHKRVSCNNYLTVFIPSTALIFYHLLHITHNHTIRIGRKINANICRIDCIQYSNVSVYLAIMLQNLCVGCFLVSVCTLLK